MAALSPEYLTLLNKALEKDFVPQLPALLDTTEPQEQQKRKNLSRAFASFAIANLCGIGSKEAAKSVVDDFDDHGVDAVYYHGASETLYVVQAKLRNVQPRRSLGYGRYRYRTLEGKGDPGRTVSAGIVWLSRKKSPADR